MNEKLLKKLSDAGCEIRGDDFIISLNNKFIKAKDEERPITSAIGGVPASNF